MIPTWRERLRLWVCKHFGHRPDGHPTPHGAEFCARCGHLAAPGGAQ